MFTLTSSETHEHCSTGEWLDWRDPECDLMSETQFMTAQVACAQAWKSLQDYMRAHPASVFTELYSDRAPVMLRDAIIDACARQPRDFDKRLSIDQLCDAALTGLGFLITRDAFGVEITGDRIAFPAARA